MLDPSLRQRIVSACILSHIDFCNAVLAGLPACTLAPPQHVLNAAARFVAGMPARAHIADAMRSLNWLPVAYRIRYKICLLVFVEYNETSPSYTADTTTKIATIAGRGWIRSANTSEFDIPRTKTRFGETVFSVAGPPDWNALPVAIRNITEVL